MNVRAECNYKIGIEGEVGERGRISFGETL